MAGFYLMRRGWMNHPALQGQRSEPFSRREAWCWLMEHAAYEPVTVKVGGHLVELQRGQLSHSFRFLAAAWHWPLGRVMRFVSMLIRCRSIDTASDTGQTVITICNYAEYQEPRTAADTVIGTASNQHRIKDKEVNKLNTPLSPPSEGGRLRKARGERGIRAPAEVPKSSESAADQPDPARPPEDAGEKARRLWWGRSQDWWIGFPSTDAMHARAWVDRGTWGTRWFGGPPGSPECKLDDELARAAIAERALRLAKKSGAPPSLSPAAATIAAALAANLIPPQRLARGAKRSQPPDLLLPGVLGVLPGGGGSTSEDATAGPPKHKPRKGDQDPRVKPAPGEPWPGDSWAAPKPAETTPAAPMPREAAPGWRRASSGR